MAHPNSRFLLAIVFAMTCSIALLSGGCSSGSNVVSIEHPVGAKVRVDPRAIDSGDRMDVEIEIYDISIDRMAIKVRFPAGLSYVGDTSYFEIDGVLKDTGPTSNAGDGSTYSYLVYYATRSTFGSREKGSLWFVLEGVSDVNDGKVEVDIDIDNPDIDNAAEFDVSTPKFDAQSDADVQVGSGGSSSSASSAS